jgi:putative ABC transport system ATP-binding protein
MANIVEIKNATKEYMLGKTKVHALNGVNIDIREKDFMCVIGPSGSGKTTLLNLIGCLDSPTTGEVRLFDKYDVSKLNDKQATLLRRDNIGFIFQTFNLIPVLNVFENIEFPLIIQNLGTKERKTRVDEMIDDVGLREFIKHKPDELSGGQRQRIAVARALITKPKLILADEPTANLDKENGRNIMEIMKH